jgi:hypothetical protein
MLKKRKRKRKRKKKSMRVDNQPDDVMIVYSELMNKQYGL